MHSTVCQWAAVAGLVLSAIAGGCRFHERLSCKTVGTEELKSSDLNVYLLTGLPTNRNPLLHVTDRQHTATSDKLTSSSMHVKLTRVKYPNQMKGIMHVE